MKTTLLRSTGPGAFAPVGLMAVSPYLLVVNSSVPAKTVKQLVGLMKSKPGQMNYASAGVGP